MKKFFSLLVITLLGITSTFADEAIEVNGINYYLTAYWNYETQSYDYSAAVISKTPLYEGNITIPASVVYNNTTYPVTKIGTYAFANCPRLTSITLPNSIKTISGYAFENCKTLTTINLPNGLESLMSYAFRSCASLETIQIPNSVTNLDGGTFASCTNLRSVTLPNAITVLPYNIFDGCSNLTSINIPASVTRLEYNCFYDCNRLKHIILPPNLTRIEGDCFYGTAITEITIPTSVTYLGRNTFGHTQNLRAIYMQSSIAPTLEDRLYDGYIYEGRNTPTIYIPCGATEDYEDVWGTDYSFEELNTNITFQTNIIPEEGGYISMTAACGGTTATLTANSNTGYAFLMWSDGVTTPSRTVSTNDTQTYTAMFAQALHWEVYGIINTKDGEKNQFISEGYALPNTQVSIEVKKIYNYDNVFYRWSDNNSNSNPRTFTITQDTIFYAEYAEGGMCGDDVFYMLDGDTLRVEGTGDMYNGATSDIKYNYCDWDAFTWYYHLYTTKGITFSEGITSIGEALFYDMQTLNEVSLPASVTEIRARAFENCRKLRTIDFASSSQLTTIGDWAFYNCHNLRNLSLPEGLTNIGDAAFYGCHYLSEITLPSSILSICDNAFATCSRMEKMYVNAANPPLIDAKTFEGIDRNISVFVPRGALVRYQSAQYWSEFFHIEEYDAPSGTHDISPKPNDTQKIIRNGQILFLLSNGELYDAIGRKVTEKVNESANN